MSGALNLCPPICRESCGENQQCVRGGTAGAVFGVVAMALAAPALAGDNGVSADKIVFGQAAALEVRPRRSGRA